MRRWLPVALAAAVLVWHSLRYGFVTDDAFISFVYSRNLAEHGQLVFNLGDRVEGFTNFLWTVLLGLLMLLGLAPGVTSLVLAAACAIGTLVVSVKLLEHLGGGPSPHDHVAAALLALSAGFACWTAGGLETQMFTLWVALAVYGYTRGDTAGRWLRRAGLFLALAALTRPEGVLVAAVLAGHRVAANVVRERRLVPRRDELLCAAWFLALWAPYYAWRWWYYGWPFPNTAYVKAAGTPVNEAVYLATMRANGLAYVWQWARQSGLLYAAPLALAGGLAARRAGRRFFFGTLALPVVAIYLAYVVSVGGDFMGLHRFVMPLFFLGAILVALGVRAGLDLASARGLPAAAAAAVALALVAGHGAAQQLVTREATRWGNWASYHGIDTPAYLRVYTGDRAVLGRALAPCLRDDDFSILGGAGAQAYYGRMRGIDVFGLVSERIAHEVRPTRPRAGHNKWGPDPLLYEHDPTLVFSCYSIHRDPDRPQLNCNPDFWLRRGYQQVTMRVDGLEQVQGARWPGPPAPAVGYYTFFARGDRGFECPGRVR